MKPSQCTPPPQELSKETKIWSIPQLDGSHWYKQNKTNKQPSFIDRLWFYCFLLLCFHIIFVFENNFKIKALSGGGFVGSFKIFVVSLYSHEVPHYVPQVPNLVHNMFPTAPHSVSYALPKVAILQTVWVGIKIGIYRFLCLEWKLLYCGGSKVSKNLLVMGKSKGIIYTQNSGLGMHPN